MAESAFDCVVIGSGPGGYVAAIRAAQLGMSTAVIEKDAVGGRCLNYACIPAKAVLRVADVLQEIRDADEFGIKVAEPEVDFGAVTERRKKVVQTLTGGVSGLFKKNKITYIEGEGALTADGNVTVGGDTITVTVTPKPIPQTVQSVPDTATYRDDLTITTNAAQDAPHIVPLTMSAQGVILRALPSKTWDFGSITANTSGTYNVSFDNDGNVGTTISSTGFAAPFSFNDTSVQAESSTFLSATFTPTAAQSYVDSGSLVIAPGTIFCQPPPDLTAITMQGKGVAGPTFTVTPLLVFPPVDCSAPANAPKNVVITNSGTTPISFTSQLEKGTYYAIGGTTGSGTVDPGTTASIQVVPSQIVASPTTSSGPGPYADHLYVTINGDAYSVEISQTARGAELSYSGSLTAGTLTEDGSISVHNAGNTSVSFAPTFTSSSSNSDGTWTVSPTPTQINANGGDSNQTLQYARTPSRNACFPYEIVLAASVTGPVCKPLPATASASGCEDPTGGPQGPQ